ncbi:predicted protein [Uncinocarpus reesii 1704]|uniref:Uncharacterized protein n=1 Tax=Uncinocarpus reesii (strain UAMH 1704) TaxID=336963 RepID=C4K036_UNCRE|nr:uncharacterized protein UREG_07787 [Uncinocarpus reesii 1704]EEP82922.1 predicted protein [Uncinocarpus reesii 1704]
MARRFQRGGLNHRPDRKENISPTAKGICYRLQSERGCDKGDACRFSHDLPKAPQAAGQANAPNGIIDAEFRRWTSLIPRPNSYSSSMGVDTSRFFSLGWELIEKNNPDTSQKIITKLATDEGLAMIRAMTDITVDRERLRASEFFRRTLAPFFQMISAPYVFSSPVLEASLDTICTFLFGPQGRRAIDVFEVAADALKKLLQDNVAEEQEHEANVLTATLQVLQRVVDLNQKAQLLDEISTIAARIADAIPAGWPLCLARKSLGRIQQRLGISVPTFVEKPDVNLQNAIFDINYDLPGNLSREGRRHDNDHEDITKIKVLPTTDEISSDRPEYLPVSGDEGQPQGMANLLDRHFRLVREDTIAPIRDAIRIEREKVDNPNGNNKSKRRLKNNARYVVYQNVCLTRLKFDTKKGLLVQAEFDQPLPVVNLAERQRRDWWENAKQLRGDSLVCYISSAGNTIFFQVFSPHFDTQKTNEETKGPEATGPSRDGKFRRAAALFKDQDRASITLALVEPREEDIMWITTHLDRRPKLRQSLLEFPSVLLAAFEPTLRALQHMSLSPTRVPFADILPPGKPGVGLINPPPPSYAQAQRFSFDLAPLTEGKPLSLTPGRVLDYEEMQKMTTLDEAQRISIINALSHSFAIIQGPPGTGKSYTGVSLIKTLLANREKAGLGPIICVCYTNHALDQLLVHLIKSGVDQVVRIGSRSKCPLVQDLNLYSLSRKLPPTKTERAMKGKYFQALDEETSRIVGNLPIFENPGSWQNIQMHLEDHPLHYKELFGPEIDSEEFQKVKVKPNKAIKRWLNSKTPNQSSSRPISELWNTSLWEMSRNERKRLYDRWVNDIIRNHTNHLLDSLDECRKAKNIIDGCHQEQSIRCLDQANVVGVTTAGLARNIEMLRRVPAKVLVCEEAGEVLEAHTLTALLPSIEHAILIGDHQQLRPQINTYEFQHDHPSGNRYSLDVSLFERLINPETGDAKLPFSTLRTQRRMHPSIAELVRSTIYPRLQDHPSVHEYPGVPGMRDRLFWLNHQHLEDSPDRSQTTSFSKTNLFEVEMVNGLVSHLVRQGTYKREGIAVITPYLGQLQKLRERLGRSIEIVVADKDLEDLEAMDLLDDVIDTGKNIMQKTALVNAVRLATVDNFQGEEAKVIVISLVRSNNERNCGFLRSPNRANVLLSRAQHGMYIIGNAETASSVPMWAKVISLLKGKNQMGPRLALCCPRHPEILTGVSKPDDFVVFSPEGGCNRKCESRLRCGHRCPNMCHSESLHDTVRCLERCVRPMKGCDHSCPKVCGDPCETNCQVPVPGITLKCGHKPSSLKCYQAQTPSLYSCKVPTETKAPICGHKVVVPCGKLPLKDKYQCKVVCGQLLPCGHSCAKLCMECRPADDSGVFNHGVCKIECGRSYKTCSHVCKATCHGESPCPLCEEPCEIRCTHSQCAKKCHEPCAPCIEECTWACPHQGKCELPCAVPCAILPCSKRCPEMLQCGHQCPSICGEECPDPRYCQVCAEQSIKQTMVDYIMGTTYADTNLDENPCIIPQCGHIISMESLDAHQGMGQYYVISEEAGKGDTIMGLKPSEPLSESESKRCPVCRGPLNTTRRYARIVKRRWIDEATKKFIAWAHKSFLPLAEKMMELQTQLAKQKKSKDSSPLVDVIDVKLKGSNNEQINEIVKIVRPDKRYQEILKLRRNIWRFLARVDESEQPFQRIYALVEDVKRQRGIAANMENSPTLLQVRHRLLTTALVLRCDYVIIGHFLTVTVCEAKTCQISVDFSMTRRYCEKLAHESQQRTQPAIAVEGHILWARFAALECGRKEDADELLIQAKEHLRQAHTICEKFPGQTAGLVTEISEVDKMLRSSTVYLPVTNAERAAVYAAMALELQGTGHWYYCVNGHPFTIGECGMPMEEAMCPQCGSLVGGRQHEVAEGVTRARDLDDQFGRLTV